MARKTKTDSNRKVRNLRTGRRTGDTVKAGIIIDFKTASSRPLKPGVIRGFDPQPDPPAQG